MCLGWLNMRLRSNKLYGNVGSGFKCRLSYPAGYGTKGYAVVALIVEAL